MPLVLAAAGPLPSRRCRVRRRRAFGSSVPAAVADRVARAPRVRCRRRGGPPEPCCGSVSVGPPALRVTVRDCPRSQIPYLVPTSIS